MPTPRPQYRLDKVISGGQDGADLAALLVARCLGIPTGGTAPNGYRVSSGSNPFLELFGLTEHRSPRYPPRTEENVYRSDATLRLFVKKDSPGEVLTLAMTQKHRKPCMDVRVHEFNPAPHEVVRWLKQNNVRVLNITGNSEPTAPGITAYCIDYLFPLLGRVK